MNRAIIIGRCGKDPEIKYLPDGRAVASLSVATSEKWKDKQTGEKKEKTEWHNISAFGKLAEIIGEYVTKGMQIAIEGKITTDKWEKEGVTRYFTKILASNLEMLSGKAEPKQSPPVSSEKDDIPF